MNRASKLELVLIFFTYLFVGHVDIFALNHRVTTVGVGNV